MQKDSVITQIYDRIKAAGHDEVFIVGDFLDLGEYHAVRRALLRLEEAGCIQKIMRGVFYYPRYSELIDEYEAPSPNKVAETLARKFSWTIAPCGDTALNQLGLSTQVPAKWSYISSGPYAEFSYKNIAIEFKHRTTKQISDMSYKTSLLIQALKSLGKDNISTEDLSKLSERYTAEEKEKILEESRYITSWIYDKIKIICKK